MLEVVAVVDTGERGGGDLIVVARRSEVNRCCKFWMKLRFEQTERRSVGWSAEGVQARSDTKGEEVPQGFCYDIFKTSRFVCSFLTSQTAETAGLLCVTGVILPLENADKVDIDKGE